MNTGNFIFIFPKNYTQNKNKSIGLIDVYLNEMGNLTYRYIGYNYNLQKSNEPTNDFKDFNYFVDCKGGLLGFELYEPNKLEIYIKNCKTNKYDFRMNKTSHELINSKNYDLSKLTNYRKSLYCKLSFNVITNISCTEPGEVPVTAEPNDSLEMNQPDETKRFLVTNEDLVTTLSIASTTTTAIIEKTTLNTSSSAVNETTLPQRTTTTLESTTNLQTTSQSSTITFKDLNMVNNNESNSRKSRWLVIGLPVAFVVIFAILIPLFGFLYKLRQPQQQENLQSVQTDSYYSTNFYFTDLNNESSTIFSNS
jgi:hypothetical protein